MHSDSSWTNNGSTLRFRTGLCYLCFILAKSGKEKSVHIPCQEKKLSVYLLFPSISVHVSEISWFSGA
jgi:hypothetical protein